jgi:hypothetical protein
MITLSAVIVILVMHFLADFVCQNDWMAVNKSKRFDALLAHVCIYAAPFMVFGWRFSLITFLTHIITDAITSRCTSYLWQQNQRHWFFVVIGLDQLIHTVTLLLTYQYLLG